MEYASLISSSGWQVKNKEVPQSGKPKKFWIEREKFKKGLIVEKTLLTNANLSVGENFLRKSLLKTKHK